MQAHPAEKISAWRRESTPVPWPLGSGGPLSRIVARTSLPRGGLGRNLGRLPGEIGVKFIAQILGSLDVHVTSPQHGFQSRYGPLGISTRFIETAVPTQNAGEVIASHKDAHVIRSIEVLPQSQVKA